MYRIWDNSETPKDKVHQKIMEELNIFMERLPSATDRHLFSRMVSECCDKYCEAIKSMEGDDPSLLTPLIMALLADQQLMVNRLKHHGRNNESSR
jgi:hypothetical protein